MGNAHQVVVHHICKVVGGKPIGLEQHLIFQFLVFYRDIAERRVVERGRALVGDLLANDIGRARSLLLQRLVERQLTAGADMFFDLLGIGIVRRLFILFLAEAVVRAAALNQQLCVLAEEVAPLRLHIRPDRAANIGAFIVRQAALGHCFVDHINSTLDQTALIGVLDAKDERAAVAAGDQPGIQRRAQIADMHIARGAGREARAHLSLRDARFHFLKKIHMGFLRFSFTRTIIYFLLPCVNDLLRNLVVCGKIASTMEI